MTEKTAIFAVSEQNARPRAFRERPHRYRTAFERDRDRIIHCSAFRRLEGKTQVFTPGVNENYRTRMTHSIEVAQIGRTIAKALGLNETLAEAICLGHDLGHSPFGHNGEKVLNELMGEFGGFEHNSQTMRIVELLEHPYPDFAGLNLLYETRLGLAKHQTTYDKPKGCAFAEANCSLEGQVADIADRIAYNCHDLEDALRAGLINESQVDRLKVYAEAKEKIGASKIADPHVRSTRCAKTIIDTLVSDCFETSRNTIHDAGLKSIADVYSRKENLICISAEAENGLSGLEEFLGQNMYSHRAITDVIDRVAVRLGELFEKLCGRPELMPNYYRRLIGSEPVQRTVCDYIAGMTDRYCLQILEEL